MKRQEVEAELAMIRTRFCNGAKIHEFAKDCIALELACSYCDDEDNVILNDRVNMLLGKLNKY